MNLSTTCQRCKRNPADYELAITGPCKEGTDSHIDGMLQALWNTPFIVNSQLHLRAMQGKDQ